MNSKNERFINIYNNPIIILFLLIPFFKPTIFSFIAPAIDSFFDVWKIISMVSVVLLYINYKKLSKIIVFITIYLIIFLLSTYINKGNFVKYISFCVNTLGISLLTELCIKNNCTVFFRSLFYLFFTLISVNFITYFIYPNGIAYYDGRQYLLGIDNDFSTIFIPAMCIGFMHSIFKNKKLTIPYLLLLILISINTIVAWSATGIVMWFIMMFYILFIYKKNKYLNIDMRLLLMVFIVMEIAFVFLRVQDIFAYIIEDILGKSLTFTGRTEIWDVVAKLIEKKPILGYGFYNNYIIYTYIYRAHAHNTILEITLKGGLAALILFLNILVSVASKLSKYKKNYISGIISITIFSMLLGMITEDFMQTDLLYLLIVCGYHISEIIEQLGNDEKCTSNIKRGGFNALNRNSIKNPTLKE